MILGKSEQRKQLNKLNTALRSRFEISLVVFQDRELQMAADCGDPAQSSKRKLAVSLTLTASNCIKRVKTNGVYSRKSQCHLGDKQKLLYQVRNTCSI